MSYEEALKAAGAEVHAYETFGSYQGDWWALVSYEGKHGFVHGYYGSCSGCDAFEAEFGWTENECEDHKYEGSKTDWRGMREGSRGTRDETRRVRPRIPDGRLSHAGAGCREGEGERRVGQRCRADGEMAGRATTAST